MPVDKSLFYYGPIFHAIFDPPLAEGRQVALDLIAEGSSVLDIACGTGQLCFALRKQKRCRVIGLDLSVRMLDFARKSNPFQDLSFVHEDATDLKTFGDHSFDYATMLFLMHELPMQKQPLVLKEALRVAGKGIIVDWAAPLPRNAGASVLRLVERFVGYDHFPNFQAYQASGGLQGLLQRFDLPIKLEYSSSFSRHVRQVVVISAQH